MDSTNLAISGLASGFDWQSVVSQLIQVERAPQAKMRSDQTKIQQKNNAYGSIETQLNVLVNKANALKDPALFDSRQTTSSDATTATATASAGSLLGSYTFNISQLAKSAGWMGTADAGAKLSSTNDVSGLVLGNAGLASGITAGKFTINGKSITIATTDTLQSVFDQISTATGGAVTGSYDAATDKISLNSASPIVLGSATDTSNFLQATKLFNNGTGTISSASALGAVKLTGPMASSNLATAITDGGSGAGVLKINGVEINYNASSDAVADVIKRINDSTAGVTASYDSINDRFQLTNKNTGDIGISLEDVTGNFLAATGLTGGSLQRGQNLLYTINDGGTLTSQSNTIGADSSGLTGLSVSALKAGTVTVSVGSDTAKIKTAITDFISEYNRTQSLIDSQTASTTDSSGKVTAGILTGESDANNIASSLRHAVGATLSGLSGVFKNMDAFGIVTNGNDNSLLLSDSSKLESALANNLSGVKDFFANSTNGLAVGLSTYIDGLVGDNGSLASHKAALDKQSRDIDTNIASMERIVLAEQARLTSSFIAMETAQSNINQQLKFLNQNLGIQ